MVSSVVMGVFFLVQIVLYPTLCAFYNFTIETHNWANNIKQTKLTSSSFSSRLHTELRYLPEIRLESRHFRHNSMDLVVMSLAHLMDPPQSPQ